MERFLRTSRLIGDERLQRLHDSRVTIIGLGAVGGYAAEALARAGVGHLTFVDFDTIGLTNMNRQILALESTLGMQKTCAAKARVLDINPECRVRDLEMFAHEDTFQEIFSERTDLLIDAIDSMSPKLSLLEYAWRQGIPTVSSMGAALRTDPTAIEHADLMDTYGCPLARQVRQKLRRRGVGKGIHSVFSSEVIDFQYRDAESEEAAEQTLDRGRTRRVLGSMPTITGIFGLTAAQLAIDLLIADRTS